MFLISKVFVSVATIWFVYTAETCRTVPFTCLILINN